MSRFRQVKCVLFDMDGLLLDTERLYTEGTQKILSEYGHTYDWSFKSRLMGQRTDEVARMVVEHYKLPFSPAEWITRSQAVYRELFPTVQSLPGVARLVHHLARHGIPLAVASSSSTAAYKLKTEQHTGLFSLFDAVVLGDEERVERGKPAPDIFLVAAAELGTPPPDCLVLEDAPLGVLAGKAAGCQVVMVPDSRLDPATRENPHLVLDTLNGLDPTLFGLPGFSYSPVTHVIFDMDGLLLNTQEMYSAVSRRLLAQHGQQPDWQFKMSVIGRRAEEVADMAVSHYGLPYTGPEYLALHQAELAALLPNCDLLPGAERLVRHLHGCGIPIALATSSSLASLTTKTATKHQEFFSLFSPVVTGCDPALATAKPDPAIYRLAATRFSEPPASPAACLVFEDAPNGVTAGLGAGMQVVMVPHPNTRKQHLLPATQLLASLQHFRPQDFGLPPFPDTDSSEVTST